MVGRLVRSSPELEAGSVLVSWFSVRQVIGRRRQTRGGRGAGRSPDLKISATDEKERKATT
jgi:hypothetical protein